MKKVFTLIFAILTISILTVGLFCVDAVAVTSDTACESDSVVLATADQVLPTENVIFDDYYGPSYIFNHNANGGTLVDGVEPSYLLERDEFMLFPDYCSRDGYYCIGWTVRRDTDRKWLVDGKGWVSEDQITSSDKKTVYENYEIILIDDAWIEGLSYGGSYTFYAVWKEGEADRGDVNIDGEVDMDDAIYSLFHINFPDFYPTLVIVDFDGNGRINMDDAIYLLFHVNFPSSYPLH